MSCENCETIWEVDDVEPECIEGQCRIPDPGERGPKVFALRALLISLSELHIGSEILRMFNADLEDLELLALIEEESRDIQEENKGING